MSHKVPKDELDARLAALRAALTQADPAWQMAILGDKISMYYFTGTMQVGAFVVTPDSAVLWVRRDLGRAGGIAVPRYPPHEKLPQPGRSLSRPASRLAR